MAYVAHAIVENKMRFGPCRRFVNVKPAGTTPAQDMLWSLTMFVARISFAGHRAFSDTMRKPLCL